MTSVLRGIGQKKEGLTRFLSPESPAYGNGLGDVVLFPFSYSNQVLDISYEGNDFKSIMVDSTGNNPDSETTTAIRILSGPVIATSLGANFKEYIRSWRSGNIDAGSPIEMYVAPQLLRVQQADLAHIDAGGSSYEISVTAPASDNYISGDVTNQYNSTYIFKTPLTFTIVNGGATEYITFRTVLEQE